MLKNLPIKYLLLINGLFWIAVNAMFAYVKIRARDEYLAFWAWFDFAWRAAPWFVLWFFAVIAVFGANVWINQSRHNKSSKVLMHSVLMIVVLTVYWLISSFVHIVIEGSDWSAFLPFLSRQIFETFQMDVIIYFVVLAVCRGIYFYDLAISEKVELKRLQLVLVDEQLKTLRSQLNPHFLFNSLNTIASLVRLKREKEAVKALSSLSMMLRTILDNKSHDEVKVKDEITFIKSYLTIQKMRFDDKLEVQINVEADCMDIEIPNMLLHPLIENAIQHGSQSEAKKNPLQLQISKGHGMLSIRMLNAVSTGDGHKGHGIGVTNTRERLARLYEHFQLDLRRLDNGMFETQLAIPLGEMDA